MTQRELEIADTCNRRVKQETCANVAIGFGFTFNWSSRVCADFQTSYIAWVRKQVVSGYFQEIY